ncbi:uncharacterized protein LOC110808883 [Carica papaya]|uniref:uncharacterized protein LOC110808883 n=1 Tax=Carica papaya TaxID=3649 RepID=UPI000B8D160B|nr:uncharacterized protein LOC110808883 [Carica papaya]
MMATPQSHGFRHLANAGPWLRGRGCTFSIASLASSSAFTQHPQQSQSQDNNKSEESSKKHQGVVDSRSTDSKSGSYFPKRGQTLELVCERLAFKGKGLCKVTDTGFVVMCDHALPGERFIGRVTRRKGNYAEVNKVKTLSPHWDIVNAPCEYAAYCGGCKTQNLAYKAQLRAKEQQVHELVIHVGKFSDKDPEFSSIMKPIVACDMQFHYRNKMEFSFGPQRWLPKELLNEKQDTNENYALGLHAPGFFDKVLNVNKCLLQSDPANMVCCFIINFSMYNAHSHSGFLKHLMLKTGRDVKTGLPELMVNFVTSSYKPELLKPLVDKISTIPGVVSVMNNVNTSVGNTSVGEEEYILHGKSTITETLRGLTFQISANSFFQTNTHQAEVLYKLIEECAGLRGDGSETVLDLFCGTGTIGLTLARRVKQVFGYEVVPQAILDAQQNAKLNGINNAIFVQGDLNKIGENFGNDFSKPDIVISDPNRPGMHLKLIKFLLKLKAPHIVYISCNPATCARDLDYLCHGLIDQDIKGCYKLKSIQPVDMFPHTPHIECVCLLELR